MAETGFDPPQISDLYSAIVIANMFDALYAYDYLARPVNIRPATAEALPEISADFRTWTIKIKPGIYFSDDPAFGGKRRELVAQDYVYSIKRYADPKNKSPRYAAIAEEGISGLAELRVAAQASGKFDYDRPIEGLRALDKYTLQIKLNEPRPRFLLVLADTSVTCAVASEVVNYYGDKIMEHPVGTGPFVLHEWRRSSKITLRRNPNYREEYYDATPAANDAVGQKIAQQLKGRRLPMVDQVEVAIIDENQPRWLAFLGAEQDMLERLPEQVANQAIPNGQLAPNLAKRGIQMDSAPVPDVTYTFFNLDNPTIGGYTPDKVALRRAIALAYNSEEEVRLPRRNQAIVSNGPVMPQTAQFDPNLRTELGTFDRARAMALLDLYGYVDRNGDGWRDMPDGSPLVLDYQTEPDDSRRELAEIWKRNMDAVKIKVAFKYGKWPENLKAARAGKLMMWGLAMSAGGPDGTTILEMGYSPSIGALNHSRFKNARYDEIFRRIKALPDGPERQALYLEGLKTLVAYMPYKYSTHRIVTDMMHPWVTGYKRHPFMREFWKYVDIDTTKLPR